MKITKRQLRRIIKEELSFDNAAWESGRHDARMVAAGDGDIDWERFDNDKSYAAGVDFEQEEQDNRLSWQQDRAPFRESTIVTRRQLRRIIRGHCVNEAPDWRRRWTSRAQDAIIGILSGVFMGGKELVASVSAELVEFDVTEDEIFTVLDEMLADGTVIFDVEMDEWSLS